MVAQGQGLRQRRSVRRLAEQEHQMQVRQWRMGQHPVQQQQRQQQQQQQQEAQWMWQMQQQGGRQTAMDWIWPPRQPPGLGVPWGMWG